MSEKMFMLKYLREGFNKKIITTINKKVYFASDQNIMPGYYVGRVIEEYEKSGVFDAIPISKLPLKIWIDNCVAGTYIKQDRANNKIIIFQSKAPQNIRDDEEPIYTIALSDKQAVDLWGENYKKSVLTTQNGIKIISTDGYTPVEKLKEIQNKRIKRTIEE